MRLVIQNVEQAKVTINNKLERLINKGLLIYVGISTKDVNADYQEKIQKFVKKLPDLQVFKNSKNKIKKRLSDFDGDVLLIPNFTLYGSNSKWTQIDFSNSASFKPAKKIYDYLIDQLKATWVFIKTGEFGSMMKVESELNWPINIIIEL